ncbi:MAG: ACT domain-containing protein [Anaerolineae bacterium]|nr:ACT domain-containing protein [Anaerolineae bacterium]
MTKAKAGGIIQNPNLARIGVMSMPDRPGIASAVLSALGKRGINVEFIVQCIDLENRSHIILCVAQDSLEEALAAIEKTRSEVLPEEVICQRDVAMVSVFGPHFRDYPGIAGLTFSALAGAGINILAISTSISTISCVISRDGLSEAVRALQKAFDVPSSAVFTAACGLSLRSTACEEKN